MSQRKEFQKNSRNLDQLRETNPYSQTDYVTYGQCKSKLKKNRKFDRNSALTSQRLESIISFNSG